MTHKQVLIVRKDLKMSIGKSCSQTSHASLAAILDVIRSGEGIEDPRVKPWLQSSFTKVCLAANSEDELVQLQKVAKEAGLITCLITDNGTTVFHGVPTKTVLAIGPDEISKIDAVTGHLKLFS